MGNCCSPRQSSVVETESVAAVRANFARELAAARKAWETRDTKPFHDRFTHVKGLGAGAFAHVALVKEVGGEGMYAAKYIQKDFEDYNEQIEANITKAAIMSLLQGHPNMVKYIATAEDKHNVIVVLQHCEGGDLFEAVTSKGHFSEQEAAIVIRQLLSFLDFCHSKGITHRDLKPENLLLARKGDLNSLVVIDWGTSAFCADGEQLTERIGTLYYVAPEVLSSLYDKKVDIWSVGVIMYILLTGRPPFCGKQEEEILRKIKIGEYDLECEDCKAVTKEGRDLIKKMLTLDPKERPTAGQLLNHPWFKVVKKIKAKPTPLGARMVTRLRAFVRLNKLKKLALVVLARTMADDDIVRLREEFFSVGDAGSTSVDLTKLQTALLHMGIQLSSEELQEMFDAASSGRSDGKISYEELIAALLVSNRFMRTANRTGSVNNMVRQSFDVLDHDHDGYISVDDVLWAMPGIAEEDAQAMLLEIDPNGRVDYREFAEVMAPDGLMQMMSMRTMLTGFNFERISTRKFTMRESSNDLAALGATSSLGFSLSRKLSGLDTDSGLGPRSLSRKLTASAAPVGSEGAAANSGNGGAALALPLIQEAPPGTMVKSRSTASLRDGNTLVGVVEEDC